MVESTIAKQILKRWQEDYDNSAELSARAILLLLWIEKSPKRDGEFFLTEPFPTENGGFEKLEESDFAVLELQSLKYIELFDDGIGSKFIRITNDGRTWMAFHSSLIDKLTVLAENAIAEYLSRTMSIGERDARMKPRTR